MNPFLFQGRVQQRARVYGIPAQYQGAPVVQSFHKTLKEKNIVNNKTDMAKTQTKTKYRNRKRNYKRKLMRPNIPSAPFPAQVIRRLKTSWKYNSGAHTSGALQAHRALLNDLSDPSGSLGGQQALGFDQYSAIYRKYCVIGAKVTIRAYNQDSTAYIIGSHANTESLTGITQYDYFQELKGTQSKVLSPDVDHVTWVHKVSMPKMFRKKKLITNEDEYGGKLASHASGLTAPNQICSFFTFSQPMDQSSTGANGVLFAVTLEQIVVFYDYEVPTRSVV